MIDIDAQGEDRDTVVDMINWCLNDVEPGDAIMGMEDDEEEYQAAVDFRDRIHRLAQKMGLEDPKEKKEDGSTN